MKASNNRKRIPENPETRINRSRKKYDKAE